jgi:hypothetical protein
VGSTIPSKYGVENTAELEILVPPVPRDASVSQKVLSVAESRLCCLPRTLLEEWVEYITFNIAPLAPLKTFNKRLRVGHPLSAQKDVDTWLDLYGRGIDAMEVSSSFNLISPLDHVEAPPSTNRITH